MKILKRIFTKIRRTFFPEWSPNLDLTIESKRLGSKYGGWNILSQKLNNDSIIYSFGIGEDASFDTSMIEHFGCKIHAFDPTPRSIKWVTENIKNKNFIFHEYGLGGCDRIAVFSAPDNPNHVSQTIISSEFESTPKIEVQLKSLITISEELGHEQIDLLKMDIEGAEYEVIDSLKDLPKLPKQLLVEFHHHFKAISIERTQSALKTLSELGYGVFWHSRTGNEIGLVLQFETECFN